MMEERKEESYWHFHLIKDGAILTFVTYIMQHGISYADTLDIVLYMYVLFVL